MDALKRGVPQIQTTIFPKWQHALLESTVLVFLYLPLCPVSGHGLNYKRIFGGCTSTTSEINNNEQRS